MDPIGDCGVLRGGLCDGSKTRRTLARSLGANTFADLRIDCAASAFRLDRLRLERLDSGDCSAAVVASKMELEKAMAADALQKGLELLPVLRATAPWLDRPRADSPRAASWAAAPAEREAPTTSPGSSNRGWAASDPPTPGRP